MPTVNPSAMHIISSHQGAMAPRRQSSHIKANASGVWPLEKKSTHKPKPTGLKTGHDPRNSCKS